MTNHGYIGNPVGWISREKGQSPGHGSQLRRAPPRRIAKRGRGRVVDLPDPDDRSRPPMTCLRGPGGHLSRVPAALPGPDPAPHVRPHRRRHGDRPCRALPEPAAERGRAPRRRLPGGRGPGSAADILPTAAQATMCLDSRAAAPRWASWVRRLATHRATARTARADLTPLLVEAGCDDRVVAPTSRPAALFEEHTPPLGPVDHVLVDHHPPSLAKAWCGRGAAPGKGRSGLGVGSARANLGVVRTMPRK